MGDSSIPDWMKQWQALSQQSVNAWTEVARDAMSQAGSGRVDGFEQWSRAFAAGPGTGGQAETIERLVDGARNYVSFMQSLIAAAGANAPNGVPSWGDALRQAFTMPGGPALFEHPLARLWKEHATAGNAQAAFARLFGALPGAGNPADELKAWLQLPAFGYLREHQEHQQKSAVAWVDYQEQLARYNAKMLEAARRGFELFEGKLTEREQPGRQIESLRALYDLWVDAAEEGYAEIALSQEFREVYGELTNAQMRLRSQVQQEIERLSVDLGMPTRSELNNIGERLQALRREVRAQRGGDALIDEIAALRGEFEELKAAVGGARKAGRETPAKGVAAEAPPARSASNAKPARKTGRTAAAPAPEPAKASKRRARKARPGRAVAAVAPGNFASRIAKFADASLGSRSPRKADASGKAGKRDHTDKKKR
ncbi:MAG: class III poly(R)-hydroxyalkanoic acid synthase subunit PhaE [Dokdonella sp.]|uniref:class III poly(R)-hydroxyalkanoic acid synthase subunit PhaE n=1 Tax=Dokdonella sp. TaxID=2291710 RepID=UPI003F806A97